MSIFLSSKQNLVKEKIDFDSFRFVFFYFFKMNIFVGLSVKSAIVRFVTPDSEKRKKEINFLILK
jgi:hypothetical protein